jgi:hypothetical protein
MICKAAAEGMRVLGMHAGLPAPPDVPCWARDGGEGAAAPWRGGAAVRGTGVPALAEPQRRDAAE